MVEYLSLTQGVEVQVLPGTPGGPGRGGDIDTVTVTVTVTGYSYSYTHKYNPSTLTNE
jgi:hypothetical protein